MPMSFTDFAAKCGDWGLLPNNDTAKGHYSSMQVIAPLGGNAGFSKKLGKLCMKVPDLSGMDSVSDLKTAAVDVRVTTVIACHEVLHYLHRLVDLDTFDKRTAASYDEYDNEEELLTISGDKGTVGWPDGIETVCQPKLFNENSLCKILNLTLRSGHKGMPKDATSGDTVDLSTPVPQNVANIWG